MVFKFLFLFRQTKGAWMEELRKGRKRCKEEERWKQKNDRDGREKQERIDGGREREGAQEGREESQVGQSLYI